MPFAPITIPFLIYIGKRFGVEILPSAFYEKEALKNINIKTAKEEFKQEFKQEVKQEIQKEINK